MRKVNLDEGIGTADKNTFSFRIIGITYEITADDMCEASRTEFIKDFERVVMVPPF
jgi:hypothetical protein